MLRVPHALPVGGARAPSLSCGEHVAPAGRHEAAASAYQRVLGAPGNPQAQFQRAWSLLNVESRRDEGIEAFRNLLQSSPSSEGYFLLGCGLQEERRYNEAVEAFQEAARLESRGTSNLHYNCGVALTALRRWHEARDAFQHAVEPSPSEAGAWDGLGTALAHVGQLRDAAPCHRRAIRLNRARRRTQSQQDALRAESTRGSTRCPATGAGLSRRRSPRKNPSLWF